MMMFIAGVAVWIGVAFLVVVLYRLLGMLSELNDDTSSYLRGLESSTKAALEAWNKLDEAIDYAEGRAKKP